MSKHVRRLPTPFFREREAWVDRWCLSRIADALGGAPVRLRLWDGTTRVLSEEPPVATVVVRDRATLFRLVWARDLAFGEAYTDGRLEIDGPLVALLESVNRTLADREAPAAVADSGSGASVPAARRNVHHHYDIGNEFYQLWLDEELVYTCAYFEKADLTLEQAQRAKMDYVCRKLQLRSGERVIEAGCGWGALALHMARHYGVTVRAYNVSGEQLAYARERARREGLTGRVEFIDADYRTIEGACDVFVSVGMLEHVGLRQYPALGHLIDRVLDPHNGRGLLHFIGRNRPAEFNAWTRRYVFPGGYAPVLSEVTQRVLEPWRFSVVDVENLRLHYAKTLEHWLERFERAQARVRAMFDERFVRLWRLYLAGSQAGFLSGDLQLFQVTFARPVQDVLPRTRAGLYADRPADAAV